MPTIGGVALANGYRIPNRDAVVDQRRRWTWAEMNDDIAQAAAAMRGRGLRKGDRLALLSGNCAEFIVASHAASRLGAIVVPVNTRLAPPEVAHILVDSGASFLGYDSAARQLAHRAVTLTGATGLGALFDGSDDPPLLTAADGDRMCEDAANEGDDAFILYTSGTTGRPKGALIDHHRAVWAAMAQVVSLGLRDGDRYLHQTPMYHSGGTTFLNTTTLIGGTHVVTPAFDPGGTLDLVASERITWMFAVPTMYQQIMRRLDDEHRDLSSLRIAVFGAAPMPVSTVERLLEAFPNVEIVQQCGQTEAGPTGIYSTTAQVRENPSSSGHLAQPFMEVQVIDPDGAPTPTDGVGELLFKGEAVMKEYWRQPDASAEAIRDGWLHTGDLVRVGGDGSMTLVDRLRDVIITGGRNVYSAEVEQAISTHPGVSDVAVIGQPDPEWGMTVVAVVTTAAGTHLTEDAVRRHCRDLVADYKIPRIVTFGDVPRNSTGKVQKHLLREALASGTS